MNSKPPRVRIKDLPPAMRDAAREAKRREAEAERARMVQHFTTFGLPAPTPEFRFDPSRKWRIDLAWPTHWLALEVEGGVWSAGRHTRGSGYLGDMEKYNRLSVLGWRLLRCTPETLYDPSIVEMLRIVLR